MLSIDSNFVGFIGFIGSDKYIGLSVWYVDKSYRNYSIQFPFTVDIYLMRNLLRAGGCTFLWRLPGGGAAATHGPPTNRDLL